MFESLYIKNFAIINEISIEFSDGFNIITGETGSGKSLLLEAILALTGSKVDRSLIGDNEDFALVEGVFSFDDEILDELGIEREEKLIISRKIGKNSYSKINSRNVNLSVLKKLSSKLLDIYSQNSNIILLDKKNYLSILDRFGSKEDIIFANLKEYLSEKNKLKSELEKFNLSTEEINRKLDLLEYEISEIEEFNFDIDEKEINQEFKKLNNIIEISKMSNSIYNLMDSDDLSISNLLNRALRGFEELSELDDEFSDVVSRFFEIRELLNDEINFLENYMSNLEFDEERLNELDIILSKLFKLKSKYGNSKEDILVYLENSKLEKDKLDDYENNKIDIEKKIKYIDENLYDEAYKLSEIRKSKAIEFEDRIVKELRELNISHIDFKIDFSRLDNINKFGFDSIDFLISTNLGQEKKSLSDTASGGEMSRFMLAFKSVIADIDDVNTLLFDEIDTGISGRTAQIVAQKIGKISKNHQTILISHLPQIASMADSHFLIEKKILDNRTISIINPIVGESRVEEIARLIGGVNITDITRASAKEMLTLANERRKNG